MVVNPIVVNSPELRSNNLFSTTLPLARTTHFSTTIRPETDAPARIQIPLKSSPISVSDNVNLASTSSLIRENNLPSSNYRSTNIPINQFSTTTAPVSAELSFSSTATPEDNVSSTVQIPLKASTLTDKKINDFHSPDLKVKSSIDSLLGAGFNVGNAVNAL